MKLKQVLRNAGYSESAIDAAWPGWWDDDALDSPSAVTELRFAVSRNLGLDPRFFFDSEDSPRFIWRDEVHFKHLRTESDHEKAALSSFGMSIGRICLTCTPGGGSVRSITAFDLRNSILVNQPFVRLVDLLGFCWAVGIPVVHLRVFPLSAKRMAAMTVRIGDRYAILLSKDADYPAWIAFYLAHELGHIALGHLSENTAVVDMEAHDGQGSANDNEECDADRFALELLTGHSEPAILPATEKYSAASLARSSVSAARDLKIEPGTLALCFGHATGNWPIVNASLRSIYSQSKPVWKEVNKIALKQLDFESVPSDAESFLLAVLGSPA